MTKSSRAAAALVRAWTRLYTWRVNPSAREARLREVESDVWEQLHDENGQASAPALMARLIAGITDDLRWRIEQPSEAHVRPRHAATAAVATALAALWIGAAFLRGDPPSAPRPPDLRTLYARRVPAPPPPPPPPPPVRLIALDPSAIRVVGTRQPTPTDAISGIMEAFARHRIVALDDVHGGERGHAFRVALIRDPRFAAVANDIVVEFGNSRYQEVADRFVDGADVPAATLQRVWLDTTVPHTVWDRPMYEQFFTVVREVNARLPREQRLRILLGEPPVDWDAIRSAEDLRRARTGRSRHPADVILAEVLPRGRRALVIYGAGHLWRQSLGGANLIEHVEREGRTRAFVVVAHPAASLEVLGAREETWPIRSLALTRGTQLERQLDAVLYLGPGRGAVSPLSRTLCADTQYRIMRAARMTLAGHDNAAEALEHECARAR